MWKPPCGQWTHFWFAELTAQLWERKVIPHFAGRSTPIDYIECGTSEGMSLVWALQHLGRPGGLFVGLDPYLNSRHWHENEGVQHFLRAKQNLACWYGDCEISTVGTRSSISVPGRPSCELIRQSSQEYLRGEDRCFDVCYVDGSHNADQALTDIILMFRILRDGGLLIIDDYDRKVRGGRPQVQPAVEAFRMAFEGFFDKHFEHQKQVAFVKRPRRRRGYPPILECGPVIEPTSDQGTGDAG